MGGVCSGGVCSQGVSALGGSAPGGVSALGGVYSGGCEVPPFPPVNRITDACKNITLPQLHCRQ